MAVIVVIIHAIAVAVLRIHSTVVAEVVAVLHIHATVVVIIAAVNIFMP